MYLYRLWTRTLHTHVTKYGRKWGCCTIFNPDLCQFGLVFRPTNEQVAECTQIPWNEAVRDDIYVRRGSSSIPPVSWTHRLFWFSKVLRKWQTSVSHNYKYQAPISTPCIFMYTFRPTLKRTTNTHQLQRLLSLSYSIQIHKYLVKQFKVLFFVFESTSSQRTFLHSLKNPLAHFNKNWKVIFLTAHNKSQLITHVK